MLLQLFQCIVAMQVILAIIIEHKSCIHCLVFAQLFGQPKRTPDKIKSSIPRTLKMATRQHWPKIFPAAYRLIAFCHLWNQQNLPISPWYFGEQKSFGFFSLRIETRAIKKLWLSEWDSLCLDSWYGSSIIENGCTHPRQIVPNKSELRLLKPKWQVGLHFSKVHFFSPLQRFVEI